MPKKIHLDFETFSSVDIKTSGAYKYTQSLDFEILLFGFAFDDEDVTVLDLAQGDVIPNKVLKALHSDKIEKHAHNAVFERLCLDAYQIHTEAKDWYCTMVKSAYCGLPLGLDMVSKIMVNADKAKLTTGKALIKYFCVPRKPTKNNTNERNFYYDDLDKWEEFKRYCANDVYAEREISTKLSKYKIPLFERRNYILDQKINDLGIKIDTTLAKNAARVNDKFVNDLKQKAKDITGLLNPNSVQQLSGWLAEKTQKEIKSLAKENVSKLLEETDDTTVREVLKIRQKTSKSSVKKYTAMVNSVCEDERGHGFFQFYGANRTGRWAGRLVQLQNLKRNYLMDLEEARQLMYDGVYEDITLVYEDVPEILSQLVRTALIPKKGHTFAVADFSAIEARVISWLADETWRNEVFKTHGKIYEAAASLMFNVPIEDIGKGSDLRSKGKVAELALGYQGSVGAMKQMGGEKMGLSEPQMKSIVNKWRRANPKVVSLWYALDEAAIRAYINKGKKIRLETYKNLVFFYDGDVLTIRLPSGRKLFYQEPALGKNPWGKRSLKYKGIDQNTRQWVYIDTYGGKITENVVQAISRDLLATSLKNVDEEGYSICMHVHDELVSEVPDEHAKNDLAKIEEIMGRDIPWAKGLNLVADGYLTKFYKKD